ncbi:transglutaminase family protein [Synechococcus sp. CS-1330]|jgi:transglutaminase-like putative cysteine protease|nr:transglutaminase family protein [Synechococcus sp. CS-1330]
MQAICDWVHEHIRFDFKAVTPEKNASDTMWDRAGVCRYCALLGIPLGEVAVYFPAWFQVFLEIRWHIFDARHNIPRLRPGADCPRPQAPSSTP